MAHLLSGFPFSGSQTHPEWCFETNGQVATGSKGWIFFPWQKFLKIDGLMVVEIRPCKNIRVFYQFWHSRLDWRCVSSNWWEHLWGLGFQWWMKAISASNISALLLSYMGPDLFSGAVFLICPDSCTNLLILLLGWFGNPASYLLNMQTLFKIWIAIMIFSIYQLLSLCFSSLSICWLDIGLDSIHLPFYFTFAFQRCWIFRRREGRITSQSNINNSPMKRGAI